MGGLRSNFEEGTTRWAVRRAQWRSMGLTEEDMARPKIAVVNSSSALSSCYSHVDSLSITVQDSIRAAGGLPFEIRTVAPSDFVTSAGRQARYLMPSRDLLVNDIEVMVEGAVLDGMVCLSSCDKTAPAHLMAAARLDIPTILVIGGYQASGVCDGRFVDIDDVYESIGAYATGTMDLEELRSMTDIAIAGPGVCTGLGTANSMHIVSEALGMTMPGSAPVLAAGPRMERRAIAAGAQIVSLVNEGGPTPREIITAASIRNAVTVAVAVGASVNVVRHLSAVAWEAGLDVNVIDLFDEVSRSVPLICGIRPNAPGRIDDLEAAGGTRSAMHELSGLLETTAVTVAGTVAERIAGHAPSDPRVIRSVETPFSAVGGLAIFRGSLAPKGSIVKMSAVRAGTDRFVGPARVFRTEAEAMDALSAGVIRAGDVVVLRGFGPMGGPGTVFAASFVAALVGAGMSDDVAVVTDGELSGLNRGITVGQVMPEAAQGGPLAVVADGDAIVIDLVARRLDLDIDASELEQRIADAVIELDPAPPGWLDIYRSTVRPMENGAPMIPSPKGRPT